MRKWLRSWFALRFGLRRLVATVLVLGIFIGLNLRPVYLQEVFPFKEHHHKDWGWPLPIVSAHSYEYSDVRFPVEQIDFWDGYTGESLTLEQFHQEHHVPWTHCTYYLNRKAPWLRHAFQLKSTHLQEVYLKGGHTVFILCAIVNALFLLIVLALILFLQIPRRKVAAKVE